jgi:hypothetical protein
VSDALTGKELDPAEVDSTFFVLTVDLWDADGNQEVNLVRHSSGTPTVTISNTTTTSYPPPPDRSAMYMHQMAPVQMAAPTYTDQYGRTMANPQAGAPANPYNPPPPMAPHYYAPQPGGPPMTPPASATHQYSYPTAPSMTNSYTVAMPVQTSSATGMFTRNLIGSLSVNAFRLTNTENKVGFWFVLQDLSVRTEGIFRLKMNFVDVGSGQGNNTLNTGRAPVLATCFSDQFQVFSAKKFPGVIESTPLSKAFAAQGIKIPIRKDGPKPLSNQAEYDADE